MTQLHTSTTSKFTSTDGTRGSAIVKTPLQADLKKNDSLLPMRTVQ
jgi:hypothetical protein